MRLVRTLKSIPLLGILLLGAGTAFARDAADKFFTGSVARFQIEVSEEGMKTLREYVQIVRQPRPERIDVSATVREGGKVYTNVAIHLKGSWSFQPIDAKPSLTLNFDKFAKGQRFHGLTKIHLNNSTQDPTYLCEQLARELFAAVNVPSTRVGHALVKFNNRDLGLFLIVEGANKEFVKRNFTSTKGNLYDGGSGGDVTSALKADSGEHPENRSDLTNLVKAARSSDPAKRLAGLEAVLDVERFINFAATEDFLAHWDGYALGCNNYRVFHDTDRDKLIFMPSGMDQLFVSYTSTLTPVFKGMVARSLFSIPETRRRFLDRIAQLSTNEFRVEAIHARVDRLAAGLRPALKGDEALLASFDASVIELKTRIERRSANVAQQLRNPNPPLTFTGDTARPLTAWNFKAGTGQSAISSRTVTDKGEILSVLGRGTNSNGGFRTTALLEQGHYEFTGRAHTEGLTADQLKGTNGVILRISGERSARGITITNDWTTLSYEFDVRGIEDVEFICEFRGPAQTSGFFEPASMRLVRKGPALNKRAAEIEE